MKGIQSFGICDILQQCPAHWVLGTTSFEILTKELKVGEIKGWKRVDKQCMLVIECIY